MRLACERRRNATSPFTALLTDLAPSSVGAGRIGSMRPAERRATAAPRAVVIIDPAERGDIPRLREQGFNGYLVRPIRPLSLLTQLFGNLDAHAGETGATFASSLPSRCATRKAPRPSVLLAEDNDINALLARTVLEKCGVRVVRVRNGIEAIAAARNELAATAATASTSCSWTSTCRTWTGSRRRGASGPLP